MDPRWITRPLGLILWLVVICVIVVMWINRAPRGANEFYSPDAGDIAPLELPAVGAVFVDVPWKHLPDVARFHLIDQTGSEFDSASLIGKVHAVCFFFANCPSICRDLNEQIGRLNEQLRDVEIHFLSVSVDPENDTPAVLSRYAADFGATPSRWQFLTGPLHRIKELGEHSFQVNVNPSEHTDNIFLIDKWGRYRDRFKWDDPFDVKRFVGVAKSLARETAPPLEETVNTRNALAGVEPTNWDSVPWIREFYLTDQRGKQFYSRELTGRVWVASFFFTTCPGICPKQNEYLSALRERLDRENAIFVSITTDPQTDTTGVLSSYAGRFHASPENWVFCRGDEKLTRRIASEFFKAPAGADHHSSRLFVVDRWGQLRGSFDWQQAGHEAQLIQLVNRCLAEERPLGAFEIINP